MKCWYKYLAFAVALAFIVAGVVMEEPQIVLKKAVNICLECIGVG